MVRQKVRAITIRRLPPEVERAVEDRARRDGSSLNRAVGALLEEATGRKTKRPRRHHDFDKYAGRWRRSEADAFDSALREQRRVDPRDWR